MNKSHTTTDIIVFIQKSVGFFFLYFVMVGRATEAWQAAALPPPFGCAPVGTTEKQK
jgi:hypothetical protein